MCALAVKPKRETSGDDMKHADNRGRPLFSSDSRAIRLAVCLALAVALLLTGEDCRAQPKIVTGPSSANQIHGVDFTPKRFNVGTAGKTSKKSKGARYPKLISPGKILDLINKYSALHDVDPKLVYALIEQESRFDRFAVSPKGAQGLMQIMPGTQQQLGLSDPFDATKNIDAGVRYLKTMLKRFETETLALAAYNAGPEAVDKYNGIPPYKETKDYVLRVVDRYFYLRLRFPDDTIGEIYKTAATEEAR